jgi:hypothetical protein
VARFVLQPCKLRENRIVPVKGAECEEFTWGELVAKLAPTATVSALRTLYYVQNGAFLGLLKHPKDASKEVNFCFVAQDRTGAVTEILRRDPSFGRRLVTVYQVLEAERGSQLTEPKGTTRFPTAAGAPQ